VRREDIRRDGEKLDVFSLKQTRAEGEGALQKERSLIRLTTFEKLAIAAAARGDDHLKDTGESSPGAEPKE